jgi:hypothetical protein
METRAFSIGCLAVLATGFALQAQEQPLNASATITTGYYNTKTRGEENQSMNFVPLGARFEITGFYKSADFLNFTAEPELNVGPQASEAGFQGGNGVRFRATAFRKLIPLTFRYSNLQVEDVYFGGLSQISGYSLTNRNKELGASLELAFSKKLPEVTIDWGTTSVRSQSSIQEISDYVSSGHHLNVDAKYEHWGWIAEGFMHSQEQLSNILEPIQGGTEFGNLKQSVIQYEGSARRTFLGDSEFFADAGTQTTRSVLFTLPIDLTNRYASASLRMFQKRRVRTSLRMSYASNLTSQLLAQATGSLATVGSSVPDSAVLEPLSHGISSLNINSLTTATIGRGFSAYAGLERNEILSASQDAMLSASYLAASGGLSYARKVSWGNISGEYGREYGIGSVLGQAGTLSGQNFRAAAQRGARGGLVLDVSVHGNDQKVDNTQPYSNRSLSVEGNIGDRLWGDFSAHVGGGWQWGTINSLGNEFRTGGYTARVGIDHPRFQFSASINDLTADSLPLYNPLLSGYATSEVVPGGLRLIPSDYRSASIGLHANPLHKVELSATWVHSLQHLDSVISNDFQLINGNVTYHFRRIQLEMGFIRFNQSFAYYPATLRTRYYIRASRTVRLL